MTWMMMMIMKKKLAKEICTDCSKVFFVLFSNEIELGKKMFNFQNF